MKKIIIGLISFLFLSFILLGMHKKELKTPIKKYKTNSTSVTTFKRNKSKFRIVELFTSEGCSSCPPADKLLTKLVQQNDSNTYVLAYHVDYWNKLGWKDVFSNSEYSARQYAYANALGLDGVYTPQIIVNGKQQLVGSNEQTLKNALNSKNDLINEVNILAKVFVDSSNIVVHINLPSKNINNINVVLVQLEATTIIKRGENEGLTLHHNNIVKSFKTIKNVDSNDVIFSKPKAFVNNNFEIIIFIQNPKNFEISSAAKIKF